MLNSFVVFSFLCVLYLCLTRKNKDDSFHTSPSNGDFFSSKIWYSSLIQRKLNDVYLKKREPDGPTPIASSLEELPDGCYEYPLLLGYEQKKPTEFASQHIVCVENHTMTVKEKRDSETILPYPKDSIFYNSNKFQNPNQLVPTTGNENRDVSVPGSQNNPLMLTPVAAGDPSIPTVGSNAEIVSSEPTTQNGGEVFINNSQANTNEHVELQNEVIKPVGEVKSQPVPPSTESEKSNPPITDTTPSPEAMTTSKQPGDEQKQEADVFADAEVKPAEEPIPTSPEVSKSKYKHKRRKKCGPRTKHV